MTATRDFIVVTTPGVRGSPGTPAADEVRSVAGKTGDVLLNTDDIEGLDNALADAGLHTGSIAITNSVPDPRATNVANFYAQVTLGATNLQGPTLRADGYQQQHAPKNCVEIIQSLPTGAEIAALATQFKVGGGKKVEVFPNAIMVASRCAAKISGNLGAGWVARLVIAYFNVADGFIGARIVWTGGPNQITPGQWFVAEGFDASMPFTTDYVEVSMQVVGVTAGQPITIRMTEVVIAVNPAGDVPGYVDGYQDGSFWTGTADASASVTEFDPADAYPVKDFGTQYTRPPIVTSRQAIAMLKSIGANVHRYGVSWAGGNPSLPVPDAVGVAFGQDLIAAGIKPLLAIANFPAWLSPTHLPSQAGNGGGAISNVAVVMHVSGAKPVNLSVPFSFRWDDGSPEIATCTNVAGTTWTITRGVGATAHNDGVNLIDALFNAALFHVYYPDAGHFADATAAIVALIDTLGADNIRGIEVHNEPNGNAFDTRGIGAAGYTAWLNAVYDAVKAAHPNVDVFGGVLAVQAGQTLAGWVPAATFLADMVAAGARFDVLDVHVYPTGTGNGQYVPTSANGNDIGDGFDWCIKAIKDQRVASGITGKPMFASEYGYPVNKSGEALQALVVALCAGRLLRDPEIIGLCNNTLCDSAPDSNYAVGWGPFDQNGLRPRRLAELMARMRGKGAPTAALGHDVRFSPVLNDGRLWLALPQQTTEPIGLPLGAVFSDMFGRLRGSVNVLPDGSVLFGFGCHLEKGVWIADATLAGIFGTIYATGVFEAFFNTGLVAGNSFNPTAAFNVTNGVFHTLVNSVEFHNSANLLRIGGINIGLTTVYYSGGCTFDVALNEWIARSPVAYVLGAEGTSLVLYVNSGLVVGDAFTPKRRLGLPVNDAGTLAQVLNLFDSAGLQNFGVSTLTNGISALTFNCTYDGVNVKALGAVAAMLLFNPVTQRVELYFNTGLTPGDNYIATYAGTLNGSRVLTSSAVAVSVPADLTLDTLVDYLLPALGANDYIRVHTRWSLNNNANAKGLYVYLDVLGCVGINAPSQTEVDCELLIYNQNNPAVQKVIQKYVLSTGGVAIWALPVKIAGAIDTSAPKHLYIKGQKFGAAGDTITLESYSIEHKRI